jgi:hypothetical protein
MAIELRWFTVRLALSGIYEKDALEAVQDLQDELNMRPHLRNSKVFWETGTRRAIIQVDDEDLDSESAADGMAEEVLEVASAVLREFKRIHIEILDVRPSK